MSWTKPGMNPLPTISIEYGAGLMFTSSPQFGLTAVILADGGAHGTLNGGTLPSITEPLTCCSTPTRYWPAGRAATLSVAEKFPPPSAATWVVSGVYDGPLLSSGSNVTVTGRLAWKPPPETLSWKVCG